MIDDHAHKPRQLMPYSSNGASFTFNLKLQSILTVAKILDFYGHECT